MEIWKIAISIVLSLLGWLVAHYFTSKRDLSNKKREIKIGYLIDVYKKLENAIQRPPKIVFFDLENVVMAIQLFGSKEQILLAKKIANDLSNNGSADLQSLLLDLRKTLRKELNLEKTDESIQFLRMQNSK